MATSHSNLLFVISILSRQGESKLFEVAIPNMFMLIIQNHSLFSVQIFKEKNPIRANAFLTFCAGRKLFTEDTEN